MTTGFAEARSATLARQVAVTGRYLPYVWLAAAFVFCVLGQVRAPVPVAVWLAPVFLLRFVRSQKVLRGMLLAYVVSFAAAVLGNWSLFPAPSLFYPSVAGMSLAWLSPYFADRLMARRLDGFAATLVFPLAYRVNHPEGRQRGRARRHETDSAFDVSQSAREFCPPLFGPSPGTALGATDPSAASAAA